jgi:cell division protein FtsB
MFFFLEDNSLTTSYLLYQKKCKLEEEKNYLREEIVKDSTFVSRLNSSISEVEKYGRETYYMKRNDEDIFIITRDDEKTEN